MEVLLIPMTAILMPLVLVPTILVIKHRHERRKWEHLERLKSMETHLPVPPGHVLAKSGGIAAIGAGVPMASVLAAFLTTIIYSPDGTDEVAVPAIAWGCALLISALALATSLILAYMHRHASHQQQPDTGDALSNGKPAFDPDAFDVVSSRG
jgi:hypothetical protein